MAILKTPANDVINGTSFNDFVLSRDGDDVISTDGKRTRFHHSR